IHPMLQRMSKTQGSRTKSFSSSIRGGDGSSPQNVVLLTKHGDEAVPAPFFNASRAVLRRNTNGSSKFKGQSSRECPNPKDQSDRPPRVIGSGCLELLLSFVLRTCGFPPPICLGRGRTFASARGTRTADIPVCSSASGIGCWMFIGALTPLSPAWLPAPPRSWCFPRGPGADRPRTSSASLFPARAESTPARPRGERSDRESGDRES